MSLLMLYHLTLFLLWALLADCNPVPFKASHNREQVHRATVDALKHPQNLVQGHQTDSDRLDQARLKPPTRNTFIKDADSLDVCNPADRTYDPNDRPGRIGYFRDPIFETSGDAPWPEQTFINVVNLTPYLFKFRKDLSNQCQIEGDFDDVPAGYARQMRATYNTKGSVRVDDNADYYFDVVGTKHRFHIKATQNDKEKYYYRTIWDMTEWGLGYKEFPNPEAQVAVNFVITGSEEYGYYTSMDWASSPKGWMRALYPVIKDRQLKHVLMPGSHDAGMGRWTHDWGGTPGNTQTQGLSIYEQLVAGSRFFDLRVVEYGDDYLAAHLIDELSDFAMGGGGESLKDIIDGINRFNSEAPGEVIFLWVKYMTHLSTGVIRSGSQADDHLMQVWIDKFESINNRCKNFSQYPALERRKMSEFMDSNNGKGCVVIVFNGNIEQGARVSKPEEGIYDPSYMNIQNQWSETNNAEQMMGDQLLQFRNNRLGGSWSDIFLISQWLLMRTGIDAVFGTPISRVALNLINQVLYLCVDFMSPDSYPSVIMIDYLGAMYDGNYGSWDVRDPSLRTLVIGLNLYMATQNCNVSSIKNPLLSHRAGSRRREIEQPWNGVIFANGTRFEEPPPGFSPMYPILKAGTRFMNGSVLAPLTGAAALDC